MPGKKTEGPEWDAFIDDLVAAESCMEGTDEEVSAQLNALMIERGYDPEEVMAALNTRREAFWTERAIIFDVDPEPDSQPDDYQRGSGLSGLRFGPL